MLTVLTMYLVRAVFICEAESDECPITGTASAESNHCPMCQPAIPWDISKSHKVLEHIAAHILFNNTLDPTKEPCGLCMHTSLMHLLFIKGKGSRGCSAD